MLDNGMEIWKTHPEYDFVQGSNLGRVRTLNRVITCGNGVRAVKGRILKQHRNRGGYMYVAFSMNGRTVAILVHRLVAESFIPNPNILPEINHKDNNPRNNNVSNLEWCTRKYNVAYREKYGTPAKEATPKSPIYAINLKTQETLWFESQSEAGRSLGISDQNINKVVKGQRKTAGGYWFVEDSGDTPKIDKDKLRNIKVTMQFRGGIYAVNLKTLEVSRFESQREASRELDVNQGNLNSVLKGRLNKTRGYWFTNVDSNAVESTRTKFGNEVADKVGELMKGYN